MKKLISCMMVAACALAGGSMTAAAALFPTDGSAISSGTVYEVKANANYSATFTPASSGTLIQDGCPYLALDEGEKTYLGYGSYGQQYTWQVVAGHTYKITNTLDIWDDCKVCFTMENEVGVELVSTLPAANSVLVANVNGTGTIDLRFNTSVKMESAMLCVGDVEVGIGNVSFQSNSLSLAVTEAMKTLYANGTLNDNGGDKVTIRVNGLRSEAGMLYNGDGLLTLDYTSAPNLADIVSSSIPSVLKSYYPEGDPAGIWTVVFDHNLMNDGSIYMTINCGSAMADMYYDEHIYPKVDGATLTFDLTGKVRNLDDYIMLQDGNGVGIKINNVRDTNGNLAYGSGAGNVGSYSYALNYNYIKPQNVAFEFNPASGTSLNGVDEVEIWYNNASIIDFEGVQFKYLDGDKTETAVVLKSDLSATVANNEMTILVKVPEVVKGKSQIEVSLYNQQSLDGNTYNIVAYYDTFVVNLVSPIKAGQTIATTGEDDFVFTINDTSRYLYLRYDFFNQAGPDGWVYGSELNKKANGTWTAYNGNWACYSDFDPYLVVYAYYNQNDYNQGLPYAEKYTFTFHGTQSRFAYSDVKFVSMDPEPNSSIVPTEDFCFTMTFDGLVSIDNTKSGIMIGMGMGVQPFAKAEPVYEEGHADPGYSNVWCLYPSQLVLESNEFIDIAIYAYDLEGNLVEGNMGGEEWDYFYFSYSVKNSAGLLELSIAPEPYSVLKQLDTLTFSFPGKDVTVNYSYTGDSAPRIYDENFNLVKEFSTKDFVLVTNADGTTSLQLVFEAITTNGLYTLSVPEGYLLIGSEFDVKGNAFVWADFTVDSTNSINAIGSDSADRDIYNLHGIKVNADRLVPGIYIIVGKKVYIK